MSVTTSTATVTKDAITVTYSDAVTQSISFGSKTLTVNKGFNVSGGSTIITGALAVSGANDTTLGGPLGVTGVTTLNNALNVVGNNSTILGGALSASGPTNLLSTLTVSGANATTLGGTLGVTGVTTLNNALNVTGNNSTILGGALSASGPTNLLSTLNVASAVSLLSTLNVVSTATFQSDVVVGGNLTVNGTTTSIQSVNLEVKDPAILLGNGNGLVTDTTRLGIQMEYRVGSVVNYAGLKRLPASAVNDGGNFVLFKNLALTIENQTGTDTYATLLAEGFTSASDKNLKNNIVELDSTLEKVVQMRGVYHNWNDKNQSEKRQIGVIAQEVQAVYPELVQQGDNGYLSVNYPKLTAVLLQSIKELNHKVNELTAIVNANKQ